MGFSRLLERALAWLLRSTLARLLPRSLERWLALYPHREAGRRLLTARRAPSDSQARALRQIVEANRGTEFGRAHAFAEIGGIDDYLRRVPLRSYAELEPYLQRQQRGETAVVVAEPPIGFALSGGSRGSPRAIPVTRTCLERWDWAEELLLREAIAHAPSVASGCQLHLLPLHASQASRGGRPLLPFPVLHASARPEGVRSRALPAALPAELFSVADEPERYSLTLRLAAGKRVTLLRAAAPGTLALLGEQLERIGPSLVEEIGSGQLAPALARPAELLGLAPRPDRVLARRLGAVLARKGRLEPRDLWPSLELLCCSTTGSARAAAERLSDRFGSLPLLDPGYRAAEGILTLPWLDAPGGELALGGIFLELLPEGASVTLQPGELALGGRYQPVVTGMNGLYRYLMDDVVEVTSLDGGVPRLELAGRARFRLRLETGELREEQVGEAVVAAGRDCELRIAGFTAWLLRPDPIAAPSAQAARAESWLDRLLRRLRGIGSPTRPTPALASLALALEPVAPLEERIAARLVGVLDSELGRSCPSYDAGRTQGALGLPTLLVLKQGALARRSRRRIAEGFADAHAPFPALSDDPFLLDPDEVERQI
jgi:hypothetical protein